MPFPTPRPDHGPASGAQSGRSRQRTQDWAQQILRRSKFSVPSSPVILIVLLFALYLAVVPQSHSYHHIPHDSLLPPDIVVPVSASSAQPPPADIRKKEIPATMSTSERTFIAIKPDGVQRGLIGPIISRFEARGYKLVAIKVVSPSKSHLETHYADLKEKPFFPGLIKYMSSGPVCAMVWEGLDAVKTGRALLGATNPLASAPGTIRGDYSLAVGRNVCHGSDSVENANKEIALWFKEGDIVSWKSDLHEWIYEN